MASLNDIILDFNDWLSDQSLATISDGTTQNYFAVHYTAWLTEIFNSDEIRAWLNTEHGIALDAEIVVKLNQNSEDGAPYIEVNGLVYNVFQDFFSDRTDVDLKTGKVSQERWYSDTFTFGDTNQAPVANDDRWFVSDDTVAVLGSSAVLANDTDPDSDPLTITAINGEIADGSGIITATTDGGRTITYDTNTNKFTLTVDGISAQSLGNSGLFAEEDSFTYTIDDGNGGTATGTVNLTLVDTLEGNGTPDNLNLTAYTAYYQTALGEDPSQAFSYIDAKSGDDTVTGMEGNDILLGGDGNDILVGGDGNDYLNGGAGSNSLSGGDGDDVLVFRVQNTTENGGSDLDILSFESGLLFNATSGNLLNTTNIELVDLENGATDSFGQNGGPSGDNRLSASEVIGMTDANNTLYIMGEAVDSVFLNTGTGWTVGGPVEFNGVMFTSYTSGGATLNIDDDIVNAGNVNIA